MLMCTQYDWLTVVHEDQLAARSVAKCFTGFFRPLRLTRAQTSPLISVLETNLLVIGSNANFAVDLEKVNRR